MYRLFFKLVLQRIDAERAHALAKRSLRLARATAIGRAVVRWLVGSTDRCLETHALGLTFPSPVGVGAGVDKEADWFDDLGALGFGFVEVGTITASPQEGNAPPRVVRLVDERAILNRMGSPNPGAETAAGRLVRRGPATIVGVNIGKSRPISVEAAGKDYQAAVRQLAPVSDYLVLNVSSPNTPGLRELQDVDRLRQVVRDVRSELTASGCSVPLLIKIDPDLEDEHTTAIVTLAVELGVDGIVAVNTTVDRGSLTGSSPVAASFEGGGISGAPLRGRATEVLRCIRKTARDRLVLISVGGVESAEDVWERILAGATLVQVHTAFIYEGPAWPKQVNRDLARKVRDAGVSSIQELVGADERAPDGLKHLNGGRIHVDAVGASRQN
jgi:dihydroorotate dehydrogenase